MNSFAPKFLAISVAIFSTLTFGLSFKAGKVWQKLEAPERSIPEISALTIGTYNVENLFEVAVVPPDRETFPMLGFFDAETPIKSIAKIKDVARAILTNHYDVLVVEEVENIRTLELLNKHYLQNKYQPFLIEGNDPRGIDVGFLVKKDLPFSVEELTHKKEVWNDPTTGEEDTLLFSRDLPELHFSADNQSSPLFVLFGTHFKSKIGRKNDPESRILRKAQVERASEIIAGLEQELGESLPVFLSGDFNGEVRKEKEFTALNSTVRMVDAFDVVKPLISEAQRFTHVYLPKGKPAERSQLDSFLMSDNAAKAVRRAFPYRYTDTNGKPLPIPTTLKEKELSPSDHYPVVVEMDMAMLLKH